jgi:hypothetical protein
MARRKPTRQVSRVPAHCRHAREDMPVMRVKKRLKYAGSLNPAASDTWLIVIDVYTRLHPAQRVRVGCGDTRKTRVVEHLPGKYTAGRPSPECPPAEFPPAGRGARRCPGTRVPVPESLDQTGAFGIIFQPEGTRARQCGERVTCLLDQAPDQAGVSGWHVHGRQRVGCERRDRNRPGPGRAKAAPPTRHDPRAVPPERSVRLAEAGRAAPAGPVGRQSARELQRRGGRFALCTMCIGVGQEIAMAIGRHQ